MGDKSLDIDNTVIEFDNLTILKELGEIPNSVSDQEFLSTVPKVKLAKRVKWIPMFNFLKEEMFKEMVQELNDMWEYENMSEKIAILDKQKEKYGEVDQSKAMWRPQLGNVKDQLKAHDFANLQKQKKILESLAKDYENKVNRLKKTVSGRRGYMKALQCHFQTYEKTIDSCLTKMDAKLNNHSELTKPLICETSQNEFWGENRMIWRITS